MLPIEDVLDSLRHALDERGAAVLQAPPGAGKTTRVPLALLHERWLRGRRIVMLEPRRVAARAAARRMASVLGESVGQTVGYRMRMETRVSAATRIEVVTEGVLGRMLHEDPSLEDVALVIFDEFHERSLHADFGLALVLQSRSLLRDDLRLLVMSATLDGATVAAAIGDAPVVTSAGRAFPVETRWLGGAAEGRVEGRVARAVRAALESHGGDILVFLPGAPEIRRVAATLADDALPPHVDIAPIYGALSGEEQDRAIEPAPRGRRKVVLATSIAETSLTFEGVRIVIDSGLARVPRFSPRTGMTRLETVRVTRAAADQRRGRAGRVAPGVCYRLWAQEEDAHLLASDAPEIMDADLAPLALDLADAGIQAPNELRWLTPPPSAAFAQARQLLSLLGALDESGRITPHGRQMARLGVHPRLAHLALRGAELGDARLACEVAALLADRDILRAVHGAADADLTLRVEALRGGHGDATRGLVVDRDGVRRVRREAQHLFARLGGRQRGDAALSVGELVALAYPERVARRRGGERGRFLLRGGGGATLDAHQPLADAEWLAVADLDGRAGDARVYLAAPLTDAEVRAHYGSEIVVEDSVEWDTDSRALRARRLSRLGAIVLADAPLRDVPPALVSRALLDAVRRDGLELLHWSDNARRVRARLAFLHALDATWPSVSGETLLASLDEWLAPRLAGIAGPDALRSLDPAALLLDRLDWRQRSAFDDLAPTHVTVPSGSRIAVDYSDPAAPVLAVRLQEMFGLQDTPRVGGGRIPLTLHLLSPAHRPVQVTRDLAGFWRSTYAEVRKDLRGRYPKHHWPEDPATARPTARVRPGR